MNKIILILGFAFLVNFASGQSAAKKLLFGGFWCGDVSEYSRFDLSNTFNFSNCPQAVITSLATAKSALDALRGGCTLAGSPSAPFGAKAIAVGNNTIVYSFTEGLKCDEKFELASPYWAVIISDPFPNTPNAIVKIENGIITYVEYY